MLIRKVCDHYKHLHTGSRAANEMFGEAQQRATQALVEDNINEVNVFSKIWQSYRVMIRHQNYQVIHSRSMLYQGLKRRELPSTM